LDLKLLLKRAALLTAANWPVVAIHFVAQTTFQVLLAVPIIGAAVLMAVLGGADLAALLEGGLREIFATIAGILSSEPIAFTAFLTVFAVVLLGGSVLMFLVKGGLITVLVAAHQAAGPIEREPLTSGVLRSASAFTFRRFASGCRRLFRRFLMLGFGLMGVYAISIGSYLALVVSGFRIAGGLTFVVSWTFIATIAAFLLVAWITCVNLLYLLLQIAIAVEDITLVPAIHRVARFIRADFRELAGVVAVIVGLMAAATIASALIWSGVGLVAFVPLIGLAVLPLQLAALLVRGLVFSSLSLGAVASYVTLYSAHAAERSDAPSGAIAHRPAEHPI
jgi:hypothetical protein